MNNFQFLKRLDEDLYLRYLSIEESIRHQNSNVYLNMQIYLEHLFKFVSRRQGFNLHFQKKLGEILADYRIENFCLVKIEYNKINILKSINHYGNKYKHNNILVFNFDQIMSLLHEIYELSIKIYNYYHQNKINLIIPLDVKHYEELMRENDKFENKLNDLESDISMLLANNDKHEKMIEKLEAENKHFKKENQHLRKENEKINQLYQEYKNKYQELLMNYQQIKNLYDELRKIWKEDLRWRTLSFSFPNDLLEPIKKQ